LLTLLISLFILNGCKNPDGVGLGISSSTQLNGSLIDTSTVIVNTLPEDSVVTSGLTSTPLSYFKDPLFGTTESNIAALLNLPSSGAYSLPTGTITVDSAVLALHYGNGFYGDSLTSKYKINVYQLTKRLLPGELYYNTRPWNTLYDQSNLLGTRSFFARTHDSIKTYNIINGAPDTLIKVAPQLRIPIDKNFINNILFNASSSQLASNVVFNNNVKGLYITLDKSGTTGAGGTFMFGLTDSINVYYHSLSGTTTDTASVQLPLSLHAAQIIHTPSAALSTEINNPATSRNIVYLQGLAGTRAKVSFPYLKNIITAAGGRIIVNRAELVVTPVPGSIIPFPALPKLSLYRYDIAHQPIELEDANSNDSRFVGVSTFGGLYDVAKKNYRFIITAYVQDLMDGKTIDYGTYLAPSDNTNVQSVDIGSNPEVAGRAVVVGSDQNSPYRIRLNIIYTKINK
ncbi:MAG: DUF4270 family protein, partial [Mucilaginibacter sp.]